VSTLHRVIVLVRHASAKENSASQLSAKGLEMAETVAKELTKISPDHLFSSPTPRARITADIIAGSLRQSVIEDKRLDERKGERLKQNDYRVSWLENFDSVMSRVSSFVIDAPAGISLAVTHKEPIRAAISSILGLDDLTSWGLTVNECSLTTITVTNEASRFLSIGSPVLSEGLLKRIGDAQRLPE
jgi:broad specificity phosphatase PhoE